MPSWGFSCPPHSFFTGLAMCHASPAQVTLWCLRRTVPISPFFGVPAILPSDNFLYSLKSCLTYAASSNVFSFSVETSLVPLAAISCPFIRIPPSSIQLSFMEGSFLCALLLSKHIIWVLINYAILEEAGGVRVKGNETWLSRKCLSECYFHCHHHHHRQLFNWCSCPMADTFTAHWNSCVFLHFPVLCLSVACITSSDKWAMNRCGMCPFQSEAFKSWGMMIPFFQLSFLSLEGVHWSGNVTRLRWLGSLLNQWMESSCHGEPPNSQQILYEWEKKPWLD